MNIKYTVKDKWTLILLSAGILFFGLILPDSFSDHDKLLHFSAHFGMSFLLALSSYFLCVIQMRFSKKFSYWVLVLTTLSIGVLYKLWEIAPLDIFSRFSFSRAVEITGAMTSMSQNLSGMMAAMLLIEGMIHRNLIMSLLRSGRWPVGPLGFQGSELSLPTAGEISNHPHSRLMPGGHPLSATATEN